MTRSALSLLACVGLVALSGCDDGPPARVFDAVANETKAAPAEAPAQAESADAKPPEAEAVSPEPGRLLDRTFDDVKFDIEPDAPFDRSMLTDEIRDLHGQRIRIRGYILPTAQQRGIKQFVLVRDNQECCFGPGAALYDCILVTMQPGETTEFSVRPVAVEGEFAVDEFYGPDGTPLAIYRLDGESVE